MSWRHAFHLPKPLKEWREFAGEVAIIVIGVLIALAAGQVVQSWHWRHRVNDVRDPLGVEATDNLQAAPTMGPFQALDANENE